MATRYDLGDNSCRIAVTASDSITNIFNAISNFLVTKGWDRVEFSTNETDKTGYYKYRGTGVDGTSKFFSISVLPKEVGSLEIVALVNIQNESDTVIDGSWFYISQYNWSSRFFVKINAANNIFIFANPRWALFTSQSTKYGVGGVSVSSDDIIEYTYSTSYSNWYYAANQNWYSHQVSMETLGSVLDYNGSSLVVPSEYNYFKQEDYLYYTLPSLAAEIVSLRIENARLTSIQKSVTGCIEVVSPTNKSINWFIDSVKMAVDSTNNDGYRNTNLSTLASRSGLGSPAIIDDTITKARMCGLFSADNDFSKLSKGKDFLKNPYNNKSIVCDILSADVESNNLLGSAIGLKITQADLSFTTSFLQEVWLKVDENWNLDSNGQSKKFLVVPGGCEFKDYLPKRNWVWLNAEHTAVLPKATNFKIDVAYYVGGWYGTETYNGFSLSPIYGYWKTGTAAPKQYSHTSFLIPA